MKQNCWKFMGCGRETGGKNTGEMGICPASTEKSLNGIHGGTNAGRACWVVAGTFCGGEVQGYFAKKHHNCTKCGFYAKVRSEEDNAFEFSPSLLEKLGVELITLQSKDFYFDRYGDLVNSDDWSRDLAVYLGEKDNLVFEKDHWTVIDFMREFYEHFRVTPMNKVIVTRLNAEGGNEKYSVKYLYRLFGKTPIKNACKYAGVPSLGCT